jgi:hypothetical protein
MEGMEAMDLPVLNEMLIGARKQENQMKRKRHWLQNMLRSILWKEGGTRFFWIWAWLKAATHAASC